MKLYTIGHSNHPIEQLIQLLHDYGIALLVDVRTTPYSRHNPQFNKATLQQTLLDQDIDYVYAGAYLGGRPSDPSCYIHNTIPSKGSDYLHAVNYPEVMKRAWFIEGIQRLLVLADQQTSSIMCSEEDPALCHRHHLIARYLMSHYPEVIILHMRKDASVIDARSILTSLDTPGAELLSL